MGDLFLLRGGYLVDEEMLEVIMCFKGQSARCVSIDLPCLLRALERIRTKAREDVHATLRSSQ